jgi:hypothetical protein
LEGGDAFPFESTRSGNEHAKEYCRFSGGNSREDTRRAQVGVWIDQRLVDRDLIRALPEGAIEWQDLEDEAADLALALALPGGQAAVAGGQIVRV